MQIVHLYKYTRKDVGETVSPTKPDVPYTLMYRVIADEGKEVSRDGENWTSCADSEYNEGWQERTAGEPSEDDATEEDYRDALTKLGVDMA